MLAGLGHDLADGYESMLEFGTGVVVDVEGTWIVPWSQPNTDDIEVSPLGWEEMLDLDLANHGVVRRFTAERMDYPDVFVLPKVHGRSVGFAHASI